MSEERVRRRRPRHPVDQALPPGRLAVYGLQHVLAMYAGAVAVPLVLAGAIGLSEEDLVYLINADLFTCGIATLIQTLGFGFLGIRLPLIQGVTFAAVTPMILIGKAHGLQGIYGAIIVAGILTFFVAPYFSRLLRYFPPVVTGSIITVIGISLLPVAVTWAGGGDPQAKTFGNPANVAMALVVLVLIILIYRFFTGFVSRIAILLGLILGTIIAAIFGITDFGGVARASWLGITTPFHFGFPTFHLAPIISMCLVMLVCMVETTGDIVAVSEIVDKPLRPRDLARGLRADGFSTALGGLLNAFPYTAFAQNVGLVRFSGVRSRFVVAAAGVFLILLGLFPKLAAVVAAIPQPVLGGAGFALFGTVTAVGIQTLSRVDFADNRNIVIVAISVATGMIPVAAPDFYSAFPQGVQIVFESGITAASLTAIVLNVAFHVLGNGEQPAPATDSVSRAGEEPR